MKAILLCSGPAHPFIGRSQPFCSRETAFVNRLDRKRRLRICDFSSLDYHVAASGIPVSELSAVLHAQWKDGRMISGVEVFRAIRQVVDPEFLARMSRRPVIDPFAVKA